ncbi:MAG: ABC transporter permease [Bacteroidetes bacterium]|nr:ABC transporter permease [Bacteroidota bacterium]
MFKNYFKTAFRNIVKHKSLSFLHITGLGVSIASCLLIFTVVKYELSYDTFQPNYQRIYHVVSQTSTEDGINYTPGVPFPALDALQLDFPQVKTGALMASFGSQVTVLLKNNAQKKFIEDKGFFFCDPEFFQIFQYHWLAGSPEDLKAPNVTALSESTAVKYFGNWKDAIGQSLLLDNAQLVKVTGIIQDAPGNTDFPLSIVNSMATAKASNGLYFYDSTWHTTTSNFQVFMLLPQNVSESQINKGLISFSKKNYTENKKNQVLNFLEPLSEVHFDNRFENFGDHITEKSTLWTLSLIALFILVMACINFINLTTAQAVNRSKEMGIRKVLGGNRSQLLWQVIRETFLIVCISVLLGIGLAASCFPFIKNLANISGNVTFLNGQIIFFIFLLVVFITILAGFYPAFILSGFTPVTALKNKVSSATVGGISLRRGLVVLQFSISQILIIGTIVAITQMSFVKNADLGFNKAAVLVINSNTDSTMRDRFATYKQKLLQIPGVKSVSFSSDVPSSQNNWQTNFGFNHQPEPSFPLDVKFADEDYFKTFGLQMIAGRPFGKSDTIHEVVVNETFARKLLIKNPDDIIGKEMRYGGNGPWKTIVGVVKDFKTNSLKESIKPLAIAERKDQYFVTSVKLNSANISKTRQEIENAWNDYFPNYAFTSNYFEDSINDFYRQDNQLTLLYKIFAFMAILISCLGLYGLVSFMAIQRTKEIGVRKVLGASVQNIIYLFSKEFTILVFIGFIIAIPVSWYIMSHWLDQFVYRIHFSIGIFALAMLLSLVIAWLAVGYKSVKAAWANPVKSLKSE